MIPFVDINSWEFIIIVILALVLIGPKRLPEYVAKLRTWIRQARDMADGAKTQLKSELGPEYQDIDWRQYDPRQYDPRRIVREALFDDPDANVAEELGLTERQAHQAQARELQSGATGPAAGTGSHAVTAPVGAESVGAESMPVGAEIAAPPAPRSHVDNTYHPDRMTPFDPEAT